MSKELPETPTFVLEERPQTPFSFDICSILPTSFAEKTVSPHFVQTSASNLPQSTPKCLNGTFFFTTFPLHSSHVKNRDFIAILWDIDLRFLITLRILALCLSESFSV